MQTSEQIIFLDNWPKDSPAYPEGSLVKSTWFAPPKDNFDFIIPNHRYIFKKSKLWAPWQFWSEIISYHLSLLLDFKVPPAFFAKIEETNEEGVLIEWFYNYPNQKYQRYSPAENFFLHVDPDFDVDRGSNHNLQSTEMLCKTFKGAGLFKNENWREKLFKIFVLDTLIGNVDRHQNNWGFIFESPKEGETSVLIAPPFDNGTSHGYEILNNNLHKFLNSDKIMRYVSKGTHHIRLKDGDKKKSNHFELINKLYTQYKNVCDLSDVVNSIQNLNLNLLFESIIELQKFDTTSTLNDDRFKFIKLLYQERLRRLREILRD